MLSLYSVLYLCDIYDNNNDYLCQKNKISHFSCSLAAGSGMKQIAPIQCIMQDFESRRGRHHLLMFVAVAANSHGHGLFGFSATAS